ncbi:AEC family transporter [Alloscardovia criceti]|uniref:AEC family transporter n=1 Tax=Alloscardovia criceti TaxID=356828 RepID=UPI0003706DAB|nr:hypothetical protein [Alloscardovia criceti]
MTQVLLNAAAFVFIIIIGRFLEYRHITPANASESLRKILMNVTLPAAIIFNFTQTTLSSGLMMLSLAALGLLANVVMVIVGMVMTRKKAAGTKALYMLCLPSQNIGAFSIPFVQSFLPPLGTVTACMFDVGNSIACTGGTYAFTSEYISEKAGGINYKAFAKRLLTSTPLMTYIVMFVITSVGITLPDFAVSLIHPLALANPSIAMLMIGMMIRVEFKREYVTDIVKILGLRHLLSIVLALLCYFLLPFDLIVRQSLVIVAFAPLSILAPAYTALCGGDSGKASAINSLSIIFSVMEITALLVVMGLN